MNKYSKIILILVCLILILVACFRKDSCYIPNDEIEEASIAKEAAASYGKPETKTIDGVDYAVSRGEIGEFGGNIITSAIGEGPKTFNPWESKDATSSSISDLMFDSLVSTDVVTGEVIPKMAKKIDISDDGKSYTITLRKGLKWSDGKEITADDVIFTWNTIILGGYGNVSTRDSVLIEGVPPKIEKIDKYTVKFTTIKPFAPFLRLLSASIAPKHALEPIIKKGNSYFSSYWGTTSKPESFVTSGPFKLKEYVPAQRVVLERNPNYYLIDKNGSKLPYIDKYIVLIVGDLNNELLKFESKELDMLSIKGKDVARFKEMEQKSDYTVYNLGPDTGTIYLSFNLNKRKDSNGKYYVNPIKQKWFEDKNFRAAVDYALDREGMVFNITNGVATPLYTAESLSSIYLNKKLANGHERNIDYAKQLLKESGFSYDNKGMLKDKEGNNVEFDLYTNAGNTEREAIGVMVKQDLQELGMKINFKPIEFNTLVNKLLSTSEWDMVIMGLTGNPLEPHGGKNVWYSYGPLHMFNKRQPNEKNPQLEPWEKRLDSIFDEAALKIKFEDRKKLYDEYQQIIYDEKPMLYLYSPLRVIALRNKFGNIYPTPLGGIMHNPEEVYIIKDSK